NHFVKTDYITTLGMVEYDVDRAKEAIRQRLKKRARQKRTVIYKRMAIAASVVLIFGGVYLKLREENTQKVEEQVSDVVQDPVRGGLNKAILTLDNGSEITL